MYALTHAALAFSPGLAPSAGLTLRGCSPVVMMGTRDEFAFGKDPRVIGFRGGTASGMEEPTYNGVTNIGNDGTERNDFAFGKDPSVIGFRGGTGTGMDTDAPAKTRVMGGDTSRDHFAFDAGDYQGQVVGFQGNGGKGDDMAPATTRIYGSDSSRDEFAFAAGNFKGKVVGFQGGQYIDGREESQLPGMGMVTPTAPAPAPEPAPEPVAEEASEEAVEA